MRPRPSIKGQINKEDGFWSAMYLVFLVTLGLMGLGGYMLIKTEGVNMANNAEMLQVHYAANGAVYYGIEMMNIGELDENTALNIGGAIVTLDSSSNLNNYTMYVEASLGAIENRIRVDFSSVSIADLAIISESSVVNVDSKDSTGWDDSDLTYAQVDSIPNPDVAALMALATVVNGNYTPAPAAPAGSFYQADGVTPEVTYVTGDLRVNGNRTVHGIYIVDGDVTLNGAARVDGVIYMTNPAATLRINGGGQPWHSQVTGGVVTNGNVDGHGNWLNVKHEPTYMRSFESFFPNPQLGVRIEGWEDY